MLKTDFTLVWKHPLTHDVWELEYTYQGEVELLAGQYVMFQLAPWVNRAYSLSAFEPGRFSLIVKCYPDWKGSPMICHADIGSVHHGMLGLGHFTLRENDNNKCFIGTGTWFAPLYCQLKTCKEKWLKGRYAFIFWVRTFADSIYRKELETLKHRDPLFTYSLYLSGEEHEWYEPWYVTDWLTPEHISEYSEFYICGSPEMVKSVREKLGDLGMEKDAILFEQF